MGDVIAVCGLNREGAVLRGAGVRVIAGGGDPARLAERLAYEAPGAAGIISFGMAGALDPALRIGDWVIGSAILSSPSPSGEGLGWGLPGIAEVAVNRQTPPLTPPLKGRGFGDYCDPAWINAISRSLPTACIGPVYADGRLITDPAEKRALGRSGAIAADMESHVAARAAAEAGIPFAVLRCISDEAGHVVPPAIAVSMAPHGGLALGAVLMSIVRNPGQLPDLMRSFSAFNRAYGALRTGARLTCGRFAFDLR